MFINTFYQLKANKYKKKSFPKDKIVLESKEKESFLCKSQNVN